MSLVLELSGWQLVCHGYRPTGLDCLWRLVRCYVETPSNSFRYAMWNPDTLRRNDK